MPQRITKQLLKLLTALIEDPTREWYGLELIERTKISSGTLYPLLHRLVNDGWLERRGYAPSARGGPERRVYSLTILGEAEAAELVAVPARRVRRAVPVAPRLGTST